MRNLERKSGFGGVIGRLQKFVTGRLFRDWGLQFLRLLIGWLSCIITSHWITRIFGFLQQTHEVETKTGSQAGWWVQLSTLIRRSSLNMSRDVGYYWLRLIIYILVSFGVGTIYFDVGTSYTAILARGACGAFISGFMTFMSIGGFPSFIEEMKVTIPFSCHVQRRIIVLHSCLSF